MALMEKLKIAAEIDEEIEDVFDEDPPPDKPAPKRRSTRKTPAPKVTQPRTKSINVMAKEVGRDIATMLEMGSAVWGMRDQCCAPVLAAQAKPIGDALAQILARNPDLLRKFAAAESGILLMQCMALVTAVAPVAKAVVTNHVLHEGEAEALDMSAYPVFGG